MIIFPRGEVRTWSDLTPGALFGVSIGGEAHLAVKIQCSGDEYHCAVLTGLPPHYVREIVVQNSLLYFFPNSKIVPVGRRLQFSPDGPRPQPGSLLQNSKGLFLLTSRRAPSKRAPRRMSALGKLPNSLRPHGFGRLRAISARSIPLTKSADRTLAA